MTSKRIQKQQEEEDKNKNLGLDADHSSEGSDFIASLNNDNDMISGNPNGENDRKDNSTGTSPLDDK